MKECKELTKKQKQLLKDQIGRNVLISIGINEYRDSKDNLTVCEKDARNIYNVLKGNENITFVDEESVLLNSKENTTLKRVLEQINYSCENSKKDMNFILFYSGHGMNIHDEFYFILSDSDPSNQESILSIGQVIELIITSGFKSTLLLIDACQTVPVGGKSIDNKSLSFQKKYLSGEKGISIIYSCTTGEYSQENIQGYENSVFTFQLLEAFNGKKDALEGHYLSAKSIYKYVSIESQEKTAAFQQVCQHPYFYFDGRNDIFIALMDEEAAKMGEIKNKCKVSVNERTSIFQEEEFLGKLICKLESSKWELIQKLVAELIYNVYINNDDVNCDIQISRDSIELVDNGKVFDPTTIVGAYDKNTAQGLGAELLEKVQNEIPGIKYIYEYSNGKNNFKILFTETIFVLDKMCIITVDVKGIFEEIINIPNVLSEYYYYIVPTRTMAISQCRDISRKVLEKLPLDSKLIVIDNSGSPESIIRALSIDKRLIYSSY